MKLQINRHEKIAGIFVSVAMLTVVFFTGWLIVKQGWFAKKIRYHTEVASASGLRSGCAVEISGLKVGEVDAIQINSKRQIDVTFWLYERYREQVREDSGILVLRPFVIGDKALDLNPGSAEAPVLKAGSLIPSDELFSFLEILNGRKLVPYVKTIDGLAQQLKEIADFFISKKKGSLPHPLLTRSLDLVANIDQLVRQLNQGSHLQTILKNTASLTGNTHLPQMTQDLTVLVNNLAVFSNEARKLSPLFAQVGPELPRSAKRALEALDETVVVLKAIQKSFLLRGSAKEVREEEAQQSQSESRSPSLPSSTQH